MKYPVYVIDDEPIVLKSLLALLASHGFEVQGYGTAEDFLEHWDDIPGALVLDIRLPGMSGMELCQILADRSKMLPIILMSGHLGTDQSLLELPGNCLAVIRKPFDVRELLGYLEMAIQRLD